MEWEGRIWLLELSSLQDNVFREQKQPSAGLKSELCSKSATRLGVSDPWGKGHIQFSLELVLLGFKDIQVALNPKQSACQPGSRLWVML